MSFSGHSDLTGYDIHDDISGNIGKMKGHFCEFITPAVIKSWERVWLPEVFRSIFYFP